MLPDDLVGAVSLQTLGAGIPVFDQSFRIQRVDRVFLGASLERLKPFAGQPQFVIDCFELGRAQSNRATSARVRAATFR